MHVLQTVKVFSVSVSN